MGDIRPSSSVSGMTWPEVGSMVQCNVLHSLPDMIVVSFETQDQKVFQGALLCTSGNGNSTRPGPPMQIQSFSDKLAADNPRDYKMDSFFTVQKRHTYFQPRSKLPKRRLRARKVVCHRCRNVCSESGRNAQNNQQNVTRKSMKYGGKSSKRHQYRSKLFNDLCVKTFTLVPKIKRLGESEIRKFLNMQLQCNGQKCGRKRGRPRKILNFEDEDYKFEEFVAAAPISGRKRGRPRKILNLKDEDYKFEEFAGPNHHEGGSNSLTSLKIKLLDSNKNSTTNDNNDAPVKIKLLPTDTNVNPNGSDRESSGLSSR